MRWILIIAGVLAAVVLLMYGVGALLPTGHVVYRDITVRAAPESVWLALTDVAAFPSWRPDVRSVEILPSVNGQPAWRERGRHGDIAFRVVEAKSPTRLVGEIADPDLPYGGRWIYVITPGPDGTRVEITEEGEVHNPLFRFLSRFAFGHASTIETYLKALRERVEGDVAAPGTGARR